MRVIAGTAKGRRLRSVKSDRTRPTTDRVKEALFSSLGPVVAGARVLDLYSGSGALGIEALSRGAQSATFVESCNRAASALKANLAVTGFERSAVVVVRPAEEVLAAAPGEPVDLVLADPPYAGGIPVRALEQLRDNRWLADGATVVLEVSGRLEEIHVPAGYRIFDTRRYGDSKLVYLHGDFVERDRSD
ncbi:MAG: 16S rRNA (guanine(966)-N(2))-methyltransferase RsmD [Actinomycetota bacterium]